MKHLLNAHHPAINQLFFYSRPLLCLYYFVSAYSTITDFVSQTGRFTANYIGKQTVQFYLPAMKRTAGFYILILSFVTSFSFAQPTTLWQIGKEDNSSAGMALAPRAYTDFLKNDFGWKNRYYLVGYSKPETDWPYVLPGPTDSWAGTGPNSGIRSQMLNILFGIETLPANSRFKLVVSVLGYQGSAPPLVKILVNGKSHEFQLPKAQADSSLSGDESHSNPYKINIPITGASLYEGSNEISLTSLEGSWLMFDQVRLEGSETVKLIVAKNVFLRSVCAADYEVMQQGKAV